MPSIRGHHRGSWGCSRGNDRTTDNDWWKTMVRLIDGAQEAAEEGRRDVEWPIWFYRPACLQRRRSMDTVWPYSQQWGFDSSNMDVARSHSFVPEWLWSQNDRARAGSDERITKRTIECPSLAHVRHDECHYSPSLEERLFQTESMAAVFTLYLLIDQVPRYRIIWPRYSKLSRATTCLIKCETLLLNLPVKMDGRMRTDDRTSCWSLPRPIPFHAPLLTSFLYSMRTTANWQTWYPAWASLWRTQEGERLKKEEKSFRPRAK